MTSEEQKYLIIPALSQAQAQSLANEKSKEGYRLINVVRTGDYTLNLVMEKIDYRKRGREFALKND